MRPATPDRIRPAVLVICVVAIAAIAGATVMVVGAFRSNSDSARTTDTTLTRYGTAPRDSNTRPSSQHRSFGSGGGSYRHHDWASDSPSSARDDLLGLPGPSFWTTAHARTSWTDDPQLGVMWRSFRGQMGAHEAPPLPFEPTARHAELLTSEGDVPPTSGACQVRLLPVAASRFNCVARVLCDGHVLYPNANQSAGYVPCELENGQAVRALDDGSSSSDGDPLVDIDLRAGVVTVQDRDAAGNTRYRATLRIQS